MTLAALLERAAHRRPHADAVVDGDRRLTYAELAARARALAEGFRRLGVNRGDRVLLVLRNRLEHVLAYWALQTLGGVPTPANFRLAPGELAVATANHTPWMPCPLDWCGPVSPEYVYSGIPS